VSEGPYRHEFVAQGVDPVMPTSVEWWVDGEGNLRGSCVFASEEDAEEAARRLRQAGWNEE
jgi:hypothetical protein